MSQEHPEEDVWDLVLVHTRHAKIDHCWLDGHTVLDTTRS
jgi:hypothetical protein